MEFSKRLKELRINHDMSQEDLAKLLKVSRTSITNYELGRNEASAQILNKLSEIFNCTIDYLLGKSDIRNPEELKNVQFANAGGLDTTDLDEEDLLELQRQIDYIKKMKGKK